MFYIAILNKNRFPDIIDKTETWHEAVENLKWWGKKCPEDSYIILRGESSDD